MFLRYFIYNHNFRVALTMSCCFYFFYCGKRFYRNRQWILKKKWKLRFRMSYIGYLLYRRSCRNCTGDISVFYLKRLLNYANLITIRLLSLPKFIEIHLLLTARDANPLLALGRMYSSLVVERLYPVSFHVLFFVYILVRGLPRSGLILLALFSIVLKHIVNLVSKLYTKQIIHLFLH